MEIKTKLSIGDDIFVIQENIKTVKKVCEVCNGEKNIILYDKKYECPECRGHGIKIEYGSRSWMVAETKYTSKKDKIKRIDIEVTEAKIKTAYFPWGTSGNYFYEEDCFVTLKEAQAECERRNKEDN